MKLEIGKTYLNRNNNKVKIVSYKKDYRYPFIGADGWGYLSNGRWFDDQRSEGDLIKEALDKAV